MTSFKPAVLETYEVLRSYDCKIFTIIQWHFEEILKGINRKLTLKRKFTDPFTCTVSREIFKDTFYQVFRAIRDYKITVGTYTNVIRNKKKVITGYSFRFVHFGAFKYHFSQLAITEKSVVEQSLSKPFPCGSIANVVITEEKPLEISYKCSSSTLVLKCHFEMTFPLFRLKQI